MEQCRGFKVNPFGGTQFMERDCLVKNVKGQAPDLMGVLLFVLESFPQCGGRSYTGYR